MNLKTKGDQHMTTEHTLTKADLKQFTGTENWYRHWLVRRLLYTEGVQYVAETGGAHWLIDDIALAQRFEKNLAKEAFQLWRLTVKENRKAILVCEDGNGHGIFAAQIEYTDFPLDEITFYLVNHVLLLPSEY